MAIEFEKEILHLRISDPTRDFEETILPFERRVDPLTRQTSIVYVARSRVPIGEPDIPGLIERSLAVGCPFCPQAMDKFAMRFPTDLIPEGRIDLGESHVFAQVLPLAPYGAVIVLSSEHFIGLSDFTEGMLADGFSACQVYLQRVLEYDPGAKYHSILWNYMPPSGASQIHPHLQSLADYVPDNSLRELLEASQQYYQSNGTIFWSDLIAKEIELGERYIASTGDVHWLCSFTPKMARGMDVIAIFQGRQSLLDLSQQDLQHFSQGLQKVLRYMGDQHLYSFNLCLYSGIRAEDCFWTHARIVPRVFGALVDNSDVSTLQLLLRRSFSFTPPEHICEQLREYFQAL